MKEAASGDRLRFRRVLAAPPARVFELWTDPPAIRRWFGGLHTEVPQVSLDLRPGGTYAITVKEGEGDSVISGRFLVVEPPARLVYTWTLTGPLGRSGETTVSVHFRPLGDGTELVLEHGPFIDLQVQALHEKGWEDCFQALESLLNSTP